MELADDVSGCRTRLPKDAVAGDEPAIIRDDVLRTQRSQLVQHRLRRVMRLADKRRAVAPPRLPCRFDTFTTARLEALRQEACQAGEAPCGEGEVDLPARQSVKVGRLAELSPTPPDGEIPECDKPCEVSVGDSAVHTGGPGHVVNGPLGLVHVEVQQDPTTGPILERADRAIDLAYPLLTHPASLSRDVNRKIDGSPRGPEPTHQP